MFPVLIVFVCKLVTVKLVNNPLAIVLVVAETVLDDIFVATKFVIVLVNPEIEPELTVLASTLVAVKLINTLFPLDKFVATKLLIVLVCA